MVGNIFDSLNEQESVIERWQVVYEFLVVEREQIETHCQSSIIIINIWAVFGELLGETREGGPS